MKPDLPCVAGCAHKFQIACNTILGVGEEMRGIAEATAIFPRPSKCFEQLRLGQIEAGGGFGQPPYCQRRALFNQGDDFLDQGIAGKTAARCCL